MKIENIEVYGFKAALRGMRNPMNSWDKSDNDIDIGILFDNNKTNVCFSECWVIGENDMKLAQSLISGGSEHSKFMRQIQVWVDITAPRYWWSEFDTYKIGSTANSTSTMHKLFDKNREISTDDFEKFGMNVFIKSEYLSDIIELLNRMREEYLSQINNNIKKDLLRNAKMILPESYLNKRTINTNYAALRNIVMQRKNHRLEYEWQKCFIGDFVCKLPYAKELIFYGMEQDYERIINL